MNEAALREFPLTLLGAVSPYVYQTANLFDARKWRKSQKFVAASPLRQFRCANVVVARRSTWWNFERTMR